MKDKHGYLVKVGNRIRLLTINTNLLESLLQDEAEDLQSMIGKIFKITAMTDHFIQIEQFFEHAEDAFSFHELYLYASEEFEFVA